MARERRPGQQTRPGRCLCLRKAEWAKPSHRPNRRPRPGAAAGFPLGTTAGGKIVRSEPRRRNDRGGGNQQDDFDDEARLRARRGPRRRHPSQSGGIPSAGRQARASHRPASFAPAPRTGGPARDGRPRLAIRRRRFTGRAHGRPGGQRRQRLRAVPDRRPPGGVARHRSRRPDRRRGVARCHPDHRLHPAGAGRGGRALRAHRNPGALRRGPPLHRGRVLRRSRRHPGLPTAARRGPEHRRPLHVDPGHLRGRAHRLLLRDQPGRTHGRRPSDRRRRPGRRGAAASAGSARPGTASGRRARRCATTDGRPRSASPSAPSTSTPNPRAGGSTSSARSGTATKRSCGGATVATRVSGDRSTPDG